MTRTRPGAERIQSQELTRQVADLEMQRQHHMKHCAKCQQAGKNVQLHCSAWWVIAKKLHVALRRKDSFMHDRNPDQLELPGLDEL